MAVTSPHRDSSGEAIESNMELISNYPHRLGLFFVLQADISLRLKESKALLDSVLALQPRGANASAGQRPDDVVLAVTQEVIAKTPGSLKHRKVGQCCRVVSAKSITSITQIQ